LWDWWLGAGGLMKWGYVVTKRGEKPLNHLVDLVTEAPLILKWKYHVRWLKELVLWEHPSLAKR
jgi:hypothetical protein